MPVLDENIPAVDLSLHPAHEQQATLAQVLPSPVTPLQGTPYIDRDTSDTSTGSEDDSLVEHRPDVVINLNTLQVGQSTHTPTRRTRQCPLVPFLDSTMELEKSNIHTSLYKNKVLQIIGLNKTMRKATVNIRVSDSEHWFDCNIGDSMRVYFVGGMEMWGDIRVNELIMIETTTGTLGGQDFVIERFKRPGTINVPNPKKIGDHGPKYCKHIVYVVMKY